MKAFICARGGSKGIPKKNISPFFNSNLLSFSINRLKLSPLISEIYVSTDSKRIADIAKNDNVSVIERPNELSTDEANEIDVWRHLCKSLSITSDEPFLVTPVTSPLREIEDISRAIQMWKCNKYEIIMTRKKSSRNPYLNMITKDLNGNFNPLKYSNKIYRRQDAPVFYDILTVLYLTTFQYISNNDNLLSGKVGWLDIPEERSIDIDNPWDLELANLIVNFKNDK